MFQYDNTRGKLLEKYQGFRRLQELEVPGSDSSKKYEAAADKLLAYAKRNDPVLCLMMEKSDEMMIIQEIERDKRRELIRKKMDAIRPVYDIVEGNVPGYKDLFKPGSEVFEFNKKQNIANAKQDVVGRFISLYDIQKTLELRVEELKIVINSAERSNKRINRHQIDLNKCLCNVLSRLHDIIAINTADIQKQTAGKSNGEQIKAFKDVADGRFIPRRANLRAHSRVLDGLNIPTTSLVAGDNYPSR